ncbi:hypothetical protein NPIL_360581, partial [Nephila pilipes]
NRDNVARRTQLGGGLPSFPKGCPHFLSVNRFNTEQPRGVGIMSHLTPLHSLAMVFLSVSVSQSANKMKIRPGVDGVGRGSTHPQQGT